MPWDTELTQLKAQVISRFGETEYVAAERRALVAVSAKKRSADEDPIADVREALRLELRRLLQPQ
jgi:Holliday junction resolvase-like predicted endonuclease